MRVAPSAVSDAVNVISRFQLNGISNGTAANAVQGFHVELSSSPVVTFAGGVTSAFSVGQTIFAGGGVDGTLSGYLSPPDYSAMNFAGARNEEHEQKGHKNVQAAKNQCAPAAVANSLDWLRNTQGLPVPHPNDPGRNGDGTLVGQLDEKTGRVSTSRTVGGGVWPLDGKLKYIADNGLGGMLVVNHQGGGQASNGLGDVVSGASDLNRHGVTSHGQGAVVTFDFLCSEIQAGEDVEIDLVYLDKAGKEKGRHYVNVIGCGYINGVPYITHISDGAQTDKDPTDTSLGANDGVVQDFMLGNYLAGERAYVDQAITESIVPEPGSYASLAGIALGAAGFVLRRKRA